MSPCGPSSPTRPDVTTSSVRPSFPSNAFTDSVAEPDRPLACWYDCGRYRSAFGIMTGRPRDAWAALPVSPTGAVESALVHADIVRAARDSATAAVFFMNRFHLWV